MSTNRQKSFIAELATSSGHLHFPRLTHGKNVTTPVMGLFDFSPTQIDVSNFLCIDDNKPRATLRFYFRCTGDYYHLYIRTPGAYYGKILGRNDDDILTAVHDEEATAFNLIDKNGKIITLDNLTSNKSSLIIQTIHGSALTRRKQSDEGYFVYGGGGGARLNFYLNIIERNASYVSHPDEI
ncbi:hypothetical protein [Pseudomonas fluorescens]|uniref:Uncharacterized protein n=1 Tax=Pseudomonas fluorescens TaxID=294 RepID=A0A5E7AR20_PSEFL|nr:hypothetical protein [Pseudomonas fluorescens]VVN80440.1 hypothetical protein PS691_01049 [Pseudomonas fluorescens]